MASGQQPQDQNDPPGSELLAVAVRLRAAAPYLSGTKRYHAERRRLVSERSRLHSFQTHGLFASLEAWESAAQERLETIRQKAELALQRAYEAHALPPYGDALAADMAVLHDRIMRDLDSAAKSAWDARAARLSQIAAHYAKSQNLHRLGIDAALTLACRTPFPFVFRTIESAVVEGYEPEVFPASGIVNPSFITSVAWQPWAADLSQRPDVMAYVGHSDGIALRRDVLTANPILMLVDRVWAAPGHMRWLLLADGQERTPEAIGQRIFSALYRDLHKGLRALSIDPWKLRTSPRDFMFARPLYLDIGGRLFCQPDRYGSVDRDPLFSVIAAAHEKHKPKGRYNGLENVLLAAGLAVLIAGFAVGPAFLAASIVLDATLGAISVGFRAKDFKEALARAEASGAEEAFRKLDPAIRAYETGESALVEAILVFVEVLFLGLSVKGVLPSTGGKPGQATIPTGARSGAHGLPSTREPVRKGHVAEDIRLGAPEGMTSDTARYGLPPESSVIPETKSPPQTPSPQSVPREGPEAGGHPARDDTVAPVHRAVEGAQPDASARTGTPKPEVTAADPAGGAPSVEDLEVLRARRDRLAEALHARKEAGLDHTYPEEILSELPEEVVARLQDPLEDVFLFVDGHGHIRLNRRGKGMKESEAVFPELLSSAGPSARVAAGYSNLSKESDWYKNDLLPRWRKRGLVKKHEEEGLIFYDSVLDLWLPDAFIQRGHTMAAVEHHQMVKQRLQETPLTRSMAYVEEHLESIVARFQRDVDNFLPQYDWRNKTMGSNVGMTYGERGTKDPFVHQRMTPGAPQRSNEEIREAARELSEREQVDRSLEHLWERLTVKWDPTEHAAEVRVARERLVLELAERLGREP